MDIEIIVNIATLRTSYPSITIVEGTTVYVSGFATASDGGGGLFVYRNTGTFITHDYYKLDNGGTLIKPTVNTTNNNGIWVRQLDGHINVAYFGASGFSQDDTTKFQAAIENAYQNSLSNPLMKGSVVFVPNGTYLLNTINLRSGISFIGDSNGTTILHNLETPTAGYMFTMDAGPVFVHMANFNIVGKETDAATAHQGCFYFQARGITAAQHGGLWSSTFKNIQVSNFKGIGMYLEGGPNVTHPTPQKPNQFNIFENFRVTRRKDNYEALKMTGQQGQITFLNCLFDGSYSETNGYNKGPNVYIKNNGDITSGVISFINSTVQVSEYGMIIEYAENITIDNCWFERLGVAITVRPDTASTNYVCKSINILNNRFANAAGFGVLEVPTANVGLLWAPAIQIVNSQVNVHNNYITSVRPDNTASPYSFSLFLQVVGSNLGISVSGNSSADADSGRTFGIMQVITTVDPDTNSIDCKYNKVVFVNSSTTIIKRIFSNLNAGETILVRANGGSIKLDGSENIFFSGMNLSGSSGQLILNNGEEALFTKIDNLLMETTPSNKPKYFYTLQLTSVVRYTTP